MPAAAQPIISQGFLENGVVEAGSVSALGFSSDPVTAQYWNFFGVGGTEVTIEVNRTEQDLDPALWVFEGLLTDISAFQDGNIDGGDPGFVDFADDELPPSIPGGPFGDPFSQITLTLPGTNVYTVAVTNFLSDPDDGGDGLFNFTIVANGIVNVPEPASAAVLVGGLAASVVGRRRRR